MKIQEIDYTPGTKPLTIADSDAITNSKIVGDIDTKDVYRYDSDEQSLLFFIDEDLISAFIVIEGNFIHGLRNIVGTPGLVTALIAFSVKEYGPMRFGKFEPFSPEGFKWLKSFLKNNGRGMKVVDQTGNFPDIVSLEKEWKTAMTGTAGPTSLTISEGYIRHFSKTDLQPRTYYINHPGTL